MIGFDKTLLGWRPFQAAAPAALLLAISACAAPDRTIARQLGATLSIGFGENPEAGIQQSVRNIALEGLMRIDRDGRPRPWLAERWAVSQDGMTLHLTLRPGATFHDGQPATAAIVRDIVASDLPEYVGPVFDDVQRIYATAPYELEFSLKRRSSFLLEGLDLLIQQRGVLRAGTGPFSVTKRTPNEVEMRANQSYYGGTPLIENVVFKSYDSVRSAWADRLRGQVDMLYEVGADALDSLRASTQTKIYPFQRSYAFLVLLNTRNPKLQNKGLRRALNAAVDRPALVVEALNGHGTPADGPVWPYHWAYSQDMARFRLQPRVVGSRDHRVQLTCLITSDQSHERMGLVLQRQLRAIGVELVFEQTSPDQILARSQAGHFEAVLADVRMGPSLLRQYQLWDTSAPFNWGRFSSGSVDQALDDIRGAPDDAAYKAGVADFQRAIVDDPPAIFLAWGERLRAVSTLFDVYGEPGRDILSTLRLWRPIGDGRMISRN